MEYGTLVSGGPPHSTFSPVQSTVTPDRLQGGVDGEDRSVNPERAQGRSDGRRGLILQTAGLTLAER